MKAIKVGSISKAAKAFVKDFDDGDKACAVRSAARLEQVSKNRFDAEATSLKNGDSGAVNSKGATVGYWFEDHAYGAAFKSPKDFAKFLKLCEEGDDEDEPKAKKAPAKKAPAKGKKVEKPAKKAAKGKKAADSDDDEEEAPKAKAKKGAKQKPAPKKGKKAASEDDDDDQWGGEDADSDDDEEEAPKAKGKKGKKAAEADDGEEPDVDLDVDDDNSPQENAKAVLKTLKKELKRLKVKSGNVNDLLELLVEYIDETAGDDDEEGDDSDDDTEDEDDE